MCAPDKTYDTENLRLIRLGMILGHCWGSHGQQLEGNHGSLETAVGMIEKLLLIAAQGGHQQDCVVALQRIERWLLTLDEDQRGKVCRHVLEGLLRISNRTSPKWRANELTALMDISREEEKDEDDQM
jgi:hypothetical protein